MPINRIAGRNRRGQPMSGLGLTAILLHFLLFSITFSQVVARSLRASETGTVSDIVGTFRPFLSRNLPVKSASRLIEPETTRKRKGRRLGAACGRREEGKLKVECELRWQRRHSGVNFDKAVPFSSDYRGAKTHPPRNN